MSPEKIIKTEAKDRLKNNWVLACVSVFLILILAMFIDCLFSVFVFASQHVNNIISDLDIEYITYIKYGVEFLAYLIPSIIIILLSPFLNGIMRIYVILSNSKICEAKQLLYYFKKGKYSRALGYNLQFFFRMLIPTILFFIPVITYSLLCYLLFFNFTNTTAFTLILVLLIILSSILTLIWAVRHFASFYYLVDDEEMKVSECFRESIKTVENKHNSIIKLFLTFIPQILLCLLVLPMLYVIPYMAESCCVSAKYLISLQKETEKHDESIPMYNSVQ